MSLQEVKLLLQKHQIAPNRLLGQNFLVDSSLYPKLADYAEVNAFDVVLDAGAGFGFLTRFLSERCKRVIAVEKDHAVAEVLRENVSGIHNVTIIEGDVLKEEIPAFNKVVSIPPYYLSSRFLLWLLDRKFERAFLVLQKEFADRLVAKVGCEEYGWLTVATYQFAQSVMLDPVPNWMFYPQPQVDSIVICLKPWARPPFAVKNVELFRRMVKWLFTQRNKKLGNALRPFIRKEFRKDREQVEKVASAILSRNRRVRDLAPKDFGAIVNVIDS